MPARSPSRLACWTATYPSTDRSPSSSRAPITRPTAPTQPGASRPSGGPRGYGGWDQRPDSRKMASIEAAADMWSRTDLKPADVDVAELYDGFTFLTLAWLEALGFCADGEAGPFVEGAARIGLGGDLP